MLNAQNVRGCEPRFKPNSKLCFKTLSEDEEELEILIQNKDFQTETKQILIDTKEEIQSLKSLIKTFISLLENSKQHTKNTQTQKGES